MAGCVLNVLQTTFNLLNNHGHTYYPIYHMRKPRLREVEVFDHRYPASVWPGKTGIQLCLTGKSVFSSLYWGVTVADLVHYSQWHITLFNKYLSNTSYVPGTVLSTRIHMVDIENKSSCLCRGYIPVEGDTWKQWKEFLKSYEVLESNKWHGKRQLSEGDGVS